jgi:diphthamide synthase (EF-2-diphthine--ammonia ligase)
VRAARVDGVTRMVFGDLFLADVRAYREQALAGTGLAPVFPLWGRDTAELAAEMVDRGVRATLTCVDPRQLDAGFAGRAYDADLLADLPPGVDPCGEYGEFHTFVHDGPGFARPLAVRTGEVVERDGFVFADVLPVPDLPVPDAG